jgi:hypothetical protein
MYNDWPAYILFVGEVHGPFVQQTNKIPHRSPFIWDEQEIIKKTSTGFRLNIGTPTERSGKMKTAIDYYDFWRGLQWALLFSPLSFVALVHKNPSYVECTRYCRNILPVYVKLQ